MNKRITKSKELMHFVNVLLYYKRVSKKKKNCHPKFSFKNRDPKFPHLKNRHPRLAWGDNSSGDPTCLA